MRKIYYVDLDMCGGDWLPQEFDLEEFCEVLQGKVDGDVEIVPVPYPEEHAINYDDKLVPDPVFHEAMGEYWPH